MFLDAKTMNKTESQQKVKNKNFLGKYEKRRGRCWFFPRKVAETTKAGALSPEK
jgi:hypothetical protein